MRAAVLAFVLAFLGAGSYGAYSYVHDYEVYRGFTPATTPAGIAAGRVGSVQFYSPALRQRRRYIVYIPPGYSKAARRGARFPVLYLLHAPPGTPKHYLTPGAVNVRLDELIAAGRVPPFLVVMPYGHTSSFGSDTEWANARAGPWEDFVRDVVRAVDRRFATIRGRRGRAIAGLSEGGYAAANLALRNLGTFGLFESWSGYFVQTPTLAFAGLPPATLRANSPLFEAETPRVRQAIRRLGLWAFVYQGARDDVSAPLMLRFVRELRAAGAHVRWRIYPGKHNWSFWRSHVPASLLFAGEYFAQATRAAER